MEGIILKNIINYISGFDNILHGNYGNECNMQYSKNIVLII